MGFSSSLEIQKWVGCSVYRQWGRALTDKGPGCWAAGPGQDQVWGSNWDQTQSGGHQANPQQQDMSQGKPGSWAAGDGSGRESQEPGSGHHCSTVWCSTGGARAEASAKKQLPRGRRKRPSLLCFFTTALMSREPDLGHSQLRSRRGCAQHPDKEVQFFHPHLETSFSPPSPNLLEKIAVRRELYLISVYYFPKSSAG